MLFRKNVTEKSLINCRVLPLVKINPCILDTPVYKNKLFICPLSFRIPDYKHKNNDSKN
jgi:hypothetical protein